MKKAFFFIVSLFAFTLFGLGQQLPLRRLSIGDTVPDIRFTKVFNSCSVPAQLSGNNKPIIIIDLWATWCNSCIFHFPGLDSLQKMFDDSVQILLVNNQHTTQDSLEKVKRFIMEYKAKHLDFTLPVIYDSSKFIRYAFPVRHIPHYIWLDSNRKIIAMTGAEQMNAETIAGVLRGRLPYPMKLDHFDLSPND